MQMRCKSVRADKSVRVKGDIYVALAMLVPQRSGWLGGRELFVFSFPLTAV